MHVKSRLALVMENKGVKNFSELSLLTGIEMFKLTRFPQTSRGTYGSKIDFNTLKKLSEFFDCNEEALIELDNKESEYNIQYSPREGIVYFLLFENNLVKIGWSSNFLPRKTTLENEHNMKSDLIGYVASSDCLTLEKTFHTIFIDKRVNGEFFDLSAKDLLLLQRFENGEKTLPKKKSIS